MSVEQMECAIKSPSPEERERFAFWFDEHRHELIRRDQIENAQQREVLKRLRETALNPEMLEAFEESDWERMIRDVSRTSNS